MALMDDMSATPFAGYSVRKLRTAYTGYCMQVRRTSDDTLQDIGFDVNGDLDTAAILAFVGAGDGRVRTWYDQSGNGANLVMTLNINQPAIAASGAILTDGAQGRPALSFTTYFQANMETTTTYAWTVTGNWEHMLFSVGGGPGCHIGLGNSTTNQNSVLSATYTGTTYGSWFGGWGQVGSGTWEAGTYKTALAIRSKQVTGSLVVGHQDGTQVTSFSYSSYGTSSSKKICVGMQVPSVGNVFLNARMSEAIYCDFYNSADRSVVYTSQDEYFVSGSTNVDMSVSASATADSEFLPDVDVSFEQTANITTTVSTDFPVDVSFAVLVNASSEFARTVFTGIIIGGDASKANASSSLTVNVGINMVLSEKVISTSFYSLDADQLASGRFPDIVNTKGE